jgi:hypothetical protein
MRVHYRRRRFGRLSIRNAALLERISPEPGGTFASTRDLGLGGCSAVSPVPLGHGAVLKIYLSLGSEVVEALARVVHERPWRDGRYRLGLEILQMDQVHRARYSLGLRGLEGDA